MYELATPRPGVFVFEDEDTAGDAVIEIRSALETRGYHAPLASQGSSVVLPPPFEVRHGSFIGRTLRGEEYDPYARACTEIAAFMAPTRVFVRIEEMHVFDWHVFTPAHWAVLNALYPTLPGWLGDDGGVPMWFGRDEEVGPYLWVSVEPPGLQLAAAVTREELEAWRAGFDAGTRALPVRSID